MEGTKKHLIAMVLSVFAFILLMTVFAAMMINCSKDPFIVKPAATNCDSLNSTINALYIENGRYEIIMNRLYERDSIMYNEITSNLE